MNEEPKAKPLTVPELDAQWAEYQRRRMTELAERIRVLGLLIERMHFDQEALVAKLHERIHPDG